MIPPSINGKTFAMETLNLTSTLNTIEIWSSTNMSEEPHPIHIHGSPFQVLVRNAPPLVAGQPLPAGGELPPEYELGWKDTIIVKAGERADLIKGVRDFADFDGEFIQKAAEHPAPCGRGMNVCQMCLRGKQSAKPPRHVTPSTETRRCFTVLGSGSSGPWLLVTAQGPASHAPARTPK
ncbi:MAG TPA: multicopper oxidase domain-containing protein [Herpetosiphonaceae bacterium]|nr:multicopper oxidase domain-containing protein [Herpetosiphonaceae bacterium]